MKLAVALPLRRFDEMGRRTVRRIRECDDEGDDD